MRATPRPAGGAASSRWTVACPSPTPATSSTELVGPVGSAPIPIPRSRARGMPPSCREPRRRGSREMLAPCAVPVVWSPDTRRHDPKHEVWVGVADPRHRGARAGRRDPRRAASDGHRLHRGRRRTTTTVARRRSTTPSCWTSSRARPTPGPPGRTTSWSARTGSCRTSSRPPALLGRLPSPCPPRAARASRPVLLRHDDAGRAGHLGGGPGRRRLRPDRGRPGRRRVSGRRTRCAGRPATTSTPARVRRLLLPQQRGGRRRGAARRPATSGSRSSTSTPTTATAPQAIF